MNNIVKFFNNPATKVVGKNVGIVARNVLVTGAAVTVAGVLALKSKDIQKETVEAVSQIGKVTKVALADAKAAKEAAKAAKLAAAVANAMQP